MHKYQTDECIFISYRRDDTQGVAGRIYDRLLDHFDKEQLFMDVDTIAPGDDFVEKIEETIDKACILIAIIGKIWLRYNISSEHPDFVYLEIAAALRKNIRVIPVLVDNARMPTLDQLPLDLKPLTRRHAIEISHTRFNSDLERLTEVLEGFMNAESPKLVIHPPNDKDSQPTESIKPVENVIEKPIPLPPASESQAKTANDDFWGESVGIALVFSVIYGFSYSFDDFWGVSIIIFILVVVVRAVGAKF